MDATRERGDVSPLAVARVIDEAGMWIPHLLQPKLDLAGAPPCTASAKYLAKLLV